MYCTKEDVYRFAGITSSEVSEANVSENILSAESEVDRFTNTTFWSKEFNGNVESATDNTITNSTGGFGVDDALIDEYLWIYEGTGVGQLNKISDSTSTVLTIDQDWDTNPDATSKYRVVHCGHDPRRTELREGDSTNSIFIEKYPLVYLVSVTIDGTSVTTSSLYQYSDEGELKLGEDSEESRWNSEPYQKNTLVYWYGVYEIPREIKEFTAIKAALFSLGAQMGGTHNIPSTYSLPEGSVTIGQAYINIKGTVDTLTKRHNALEKVIQKYPFFA